MVRREKFLEAFSRVREEVREGDCLYSRHGGGSGLKSRVEKYFDLHAVLASTMTMLPMAHACSNHITTHSPLSPLLPSSSSFNAILTQATCQAHPWNNASLHPLERLRYTWQGLAAQHSGNISSNKVLHIAGCISHWGWMFCIVCMRKLLKIPPSPSSTTV